MPSYEFEILDDKGNVLSTLTLIRSVGGRDLPLTIQRKTVPQRVTLVGTAPSPYDGDAVSMKKFAKLEHQLGGPEFAKRMGRSAKEVKKIWQQPQPAQA